MAVRIFFTLFFLAFIGCSAQWGTLASTPKARDLRHTIANSGETLGLISQWYTGSVKNWKIIAANNPSISPRALQIGQQILIPAPLIVRRDNFRMPKKAALSEPATKAPAPSDNSAEEGSGLQAQLDQSLGASLFSKSMVAWKNLLLQPSSPSTSSCIYRCQEQRCECRP